jgi:uncharacterized membrane protein
MSEEITGDLDSNRNQGRASAPQKLFLGDAQLQRYRDELSVKELLRDSKSAMHEFLPQAIFNPLLVFIAIAIGNIIFFGAGQMLQSVTHDMPALNGASIVFTLIAALTWTGFGGFGISSWALSASRHANVSLSECFSRTENYWASFGILFVKAVIISASTIVLYSLAVEAASLWVQGTLCSPYMLTYGSELVRMWGNKFLICGAGAGLVLLFIFFSVEIRYSLAYFFLWDNKEMTSLEAIKKSKAVCKGHGGKLFGIWLTFLPYLAIILLPIIFSIYFLPKFLPQAHPFNLVSIILTSALLPLTSFFLITNAGFYDNIRPHRFFKRTND